MCAFYFFWLSASHDLRLGMDGMLLDSVTTGSRDRAIVPLIIIIGSIFHDCNVPLYICLHSSVVVETALSYFRNFQQWEEDHPLATSLILGATSYRDIYVAS